jgi:glycerol-3-phosphate dehydrogenase (NAD+)
MTEQCHKRICLEQKPRRVCLLGGGSFGTAIARIVADNLTQNLNIFHPELRVWLRRQELADQINSTHENEQYLPGAIIPSNVIADSDLKNVLEQADVVIVGVPHQYITDAMIDAIREHANQTAKTVHVVSLVKGIYWDENKILLNRVSERLSKSLNNEANAGSDGSSPHFEISVLMGANVYNQMGRDEFAEATLGCPTKDPILFQLFHDVDRYNISMTMDVAGVELCAVLKNVVALGVGFAVGQDLGSNTKAAIIRRGLKEIIKFAKTFAENVDDDTFFESAGIADLMTTCFSGRGQRLAAAFVKNGGEISWGELEKQVLEGHQIPDWHNVQMVYKLLHAKQATSQFPFFTKVYQIGFLKAPPSQIVDVLKQKI